MNIPRSILKEKGVGDVRILSGKRNTVGNTMQLIVPRDFASRRNTISFIGLNLVNAGAVSGLNNLSKMFIPHNTFFEACRFGIFKLAPRPNLCLFLRGTL